MSEISYRDIVNIFIDQLFLNNSLHAALFAAVQLLLKHITHVLAESKYAHLVLSPEQWLAAE